MPSTNRNPVSLQWKTSMVCAIVATSAFAADIVGTKNYMFMAVLNADATVVVAMQDNVKLILQLDFDHSGGGVTGSTGFSLGTSFSVDSTAPELGADQIYLVLDSVNPIDIATGVVGTVDMSIADAGGPMPFTVNVAFRKLSDTAFTVFDGYVTTTPPSLPSDVRIAPASILHAPPAGWGIAYAWGVGNVVGMPLGTTVEVVPELGAAKVNGFVAVYGGAWAAQDGIFELSIAAANAGWENACTFTSALSLRILSDLTLFETETLPKTLAAIIGAPAEGSFNLGVPVVTGGATLSLSPSGLVTAFTATGYPQDQFADVTISDGLRPECTPRISVNFRSRKNEGYTIVEGHLDGESNILGASIGGYSVAIEGGISMGGGGAVTMMFDATAAVVSGATHVGGANTWDDDGVFVMTIQDGSRPPSRLATDLALRRFPSAGMTYFNQQNNALSQSAIGGAVTGAYEIVAVEPADSGVPLAGLAPRPVFDIAGALVGFVNPSFPNGSDTVNLRVTDGGRPYSVTTITVDQRWIADIADTQVATVALAGPNADLELRIRDSQSWDWQAPSLPGLTVGSVVLSGGTTSVDTSTFTISGASGSGSLAFELARVGHPTVSIDIPLAVGIPPGIPASSEWGLLIFMILMTTAGTIIMKPTREQPSLH
jgi:hypothetical protein